MAAQVEDKVSNDIPITLPTPTVPSKTREYDASTLAIHADDNQGSHTDIAPPIGVSTTFHYNHDPEKLVPAIELDPDNIEGHIYSRHTNPTSTRFETILSSLIKAPTLTYSSGLSAVHAAYVYLCPKRVSIGGGYHGCHGVLSLHQRMHGLKILPLDCPAEDLQAGDVIHLETPLNPTGEARNIQYYADKAHSRGAYLFIDATFGPPGLQDPFEQGADIVMHSGTKYIGGHSDMLCGILATKNDKWFRGLGEDRVFLGSVVGNLEGWLGVRSLRTLEIRVQRQSETAGKLVAWLDEVAKGGKSSLIRVQHASLQKEDMEWLKKQMPNGFGPVFAIWMKDERLARHLPSKLKLLHHATSLGGVESLIEWRVMSDTTVDPKLLRVSVGLEHFEDLKNDFEQALEALS